jgi:hypothetical protein
MDMLEIGLYSAVTVYGVIVIWTVLVRLRWLPTALVRLVHRPMNRLGRIPVLGRVVNICRRYSLTLGLGLAILVGAAAPHVLLSAFWAFQAVLLAGAVWLGLRYGKDEAAESQFAATGYSLYYSRFDGGELVSSSDVDADPSRPYLGG